MSTALAILNKREIASVQRYGDWMNRRVLQVLAARFYHRNADGTLFTPRILDAITFAPWYHVVVIDPEALWHFSKDRMVHQDVLDALTGTVQRPVRPITKIPSQVGGGVRHGVAYVILLKDIPAETEPVISKELPKVSFDVSQIPPGRFMVPIGKTAQGDVWLPLTTLLHVMVIGESGSGKSNWFKVALLALTQMATPGELRLAIISPKRAEFAAFAGLDHIWRSEQWGGGIAANAGEADRLIMALRSEFDRRDLMFVQAGVTNLDDFNARVTPQQRLPRIVVIADEMLDLVLMAPRGSKMMEHLAGFTSVARSHGFHIFLGSTKPRFDVLPTTLTDNLGNRICFRVATDDAARKVKCPGADQIPAEAKGRAVARIDGKLIHVQAFYVGGNPSGADMPIHIQDAQPALTDLERQLAQWAIRNGGHLSLADIQSIAGIGHREARRIAHEWHSRGWLERDTRSRNKSKVTQKLSSLAV